MKQVRLIFTKDKEAKYISHLDMNRVFMRGLMLSGIPVKCTEGFNPRPYLVFGSPLPLGFAGYRETLDIGVTDDELTLAEMVEMMKGKLPIGIEVIDAVEQTRKVKEIWLGNYWFRCEGIGDHEILDKIHALLAQEQLVITKKTKRGEKEIDLIQLIDSAEFTSPEPGAVECRCVLPLNGENSINPQYLVQALKDNIPTFTSEYEEYARLAMLTAEHENFV